MDLQTQESAQWLTQSWQRSEHAGVNHRNLPSNTRLAEAQLSERTRQLATVIDLVEKHAFPLFNQMFARTNSKLILTDEDGVILRSWGQEKFHDKFATIALETGVCWLERLKGTNAIGTAIVEKKAISVIGDQHFVNQHRFISCSSCPIFDFQGVLIGVLDITSEQHIHLSDTPLLIQNMVRIIERELLYTHPNASLSVNLATNEALLDSGWQGIVIADANGRIVAHDRIAFSLLDEKMALGDPIQQLLDEAPTPLAYKLRPHERTAKKRRSTYSPSSELHSGDERIEHAWQQACRLINSEISLLILGETGVGKNEFVKCLHQQSQRKSAPLVQVNCGALPKHLIESELFGYAPGAFTGASTKGFKGKIRQADKGILFLDEIADMPLDAQCRLLHVLQDKQVAPVGSNESHNVDIQVVAATHKDLSQLVEQGLFRQDLYYRINGLVLSLPPLRERHDKQALIGKLHLKHAIATQNINENLMQLLLAHHWPGNIRELDNVVKVACLLASNESELLLSHIPEQMLRSITSSQVAGATEPCSLRNTVDETLVSTYQANKGNISKTSKILGISRNTIYRKLKQLGIKSI